MKLLDKSVCFIIILVVMLIPINAKAEQKEMLIGLIPEMNVFMQMERFKPLAEYLSKKTGVKVNLAILSRYGNIIDRFVAEKMDGAFLGSFTGALAIEKLGVEPIARPVNTDGTSTYHGYIFVRKDSGIKDVRNMKNKKMAFVEKATTAGFVFPIAYLRQNGVSDYRKFFREYYFTGSHDAAIYAVLEGKADVGAAKHSVYDRVRKSDPRIDNELVILARSDNVPSNGLCLRKGFDTSLKKKIQEALLVMDRDTEGRKALVKLGAKKFIETSVSDYRPVFDLAKKAGLDIKSYNYRNE